MRKTNINDRYRFVLGTQATELTQAPCPPGEDPTPEHLEAGISALHRAVEVEREVSRRQAIEFEKLDARMQSLVSAHNTGLRGLMMTVGQTVRELNVIRKIMVVSGATSTEQAERLYDKALPAIMEMRATMAMWRHREGLSVPEFSLDEETRLMEYLMQNPAEQTFKSSDEEQLQPQTPAVEDNPTKDGREPRNVDREHER